METGMGLSVSGDPAAAVIGSVGWRKQVALKIRPTSQEE
jgi:hypothetical protein